MTKEEYIQQHLNIQRRTVQSYFKSTKVKGRSACGLRLSWTMWAHAMHECKRIKKCQGQWMFWSE